MVVKKQKIFTGKRKTSNVRIRIKEGSGKVMINGKKIEDYFNRTSLVINALKPFEVVDQVGKYDVLARVKGGGISGQSGALRHAISRALDDLSPTHRKKLKPGKFLTRDSRKVERKHFGHKKARKSFQFSKR